MSIKEKFKFANTTNDGKLTKAQVEASGNKPLKRHFDAIDTEGKGYLTLDQVKDFADKMKAGGKVSAEDSLE
jgi:hypothetical protein